MPGRHIMHALKTALLVELPDLRRYAYCLTGTQPPADDLVEKTLLHLIQNPEKVDAANVRVELFKTFHTVNRELLNALQWQSGATRFHRRLLDLPPLFRQAVLLTRTLRFSPAETAEILDCSPLDVLRLTANGIARISQKYLSVLVIEDDAFIARHLGRIIEDMGIRVAAIARDKDEALAASVKYEPAIMLVDYQLRDGHNGFEVVQAVREHCDPAIIYITGHAEKVTKLLSGDADRTSVIVSKPFKPLSIVKALHQQLPFALA